MNIPLLGSGRSRHLLGLGAALAVLAAAPSLFAATYEVGPGKPYADLGSVEGKLAPGDLVLVTGDTTYTGGVQLTSNGAAGSPITIKGVRVNGKRPVLSGGNNTVELAGSHYVLEGFDITGGTARCVFHHADDITVRDTVVHDCPKQGILGADSDSGSLTLDYVEVYACGGGTQNHAIYMATDETAFPGSVFRMQHCYVHDENGGNAVKTRAERNEIYYNWIEGALYRELELIGPDGQDEGLAREDSDVVGNVIRNTSQFYAVRVGGDGTGQTGGRYRFVNNTFVLSSNKAVFQPFDSVESIEMHNNVFWFPGGAKIIDDSGASWTTGKAVIAGSHNWIADGSVAVPTQWTETSSGASPGFTDLAAFDLLPTAQSPLTDAGIASSSGAPGYLFPKPLDLPLFHPPPRTLEALGSAAARSIAGAAIDIGAYEHGSMMGGTSGSSSSGMTSGTTSGTTSAGTTTGAGSTTGAGTTTSGGGGSGGAPPSDQPGESASCSLGGRGEARSTAIVLFLAGLALALGRRFARAA